MKQVSTHTVWAQTIIVRLNSALGRMGYWSVKMWHYDHAPRWKKYLMGGRIYRAYLRQQYEAALDDYMAMDLCVKD